MVKAVGSRSRRLREDGDDEDEEEEEEEDERLQKVSTHTGGMPSTSNAKRLSQLWTSTPPFSATLARTLT